ncbi:hypothetical protein BDB00DRAFT_942536 [Zychaea mexicana]|uniref:uncharacterized protein n=1 Tax=Zychaea mexicana TaxID=64656 RepID=UPI0022FF231D|nr:uncharacterized protein BDB00DRAFT_942536 [Zychaea mexicana]KAI9488068.1 hypothetical protein BDB00DRAFT_942536 [Zychaea mexicana]
MNDDPMCHLLGWTERSMKDDHSDNRPKHTDTDSAPATSNNNNLATVIEVPPPSFQHPHQQPESLASLSSIPADGSGNEHLGQQDHERNNSSSSAVHVSATHNGKKLRQRIVRAKELPFYQGGVRPKHVRIVRFIGRCGFIAKGVVYGIIGVLIMTNVSGTFTPNGSQGNESPQGAFLLLGGIPAIGRPILVVMAIGLITYLCWRFWEAITGQAYDATLSKRTNFFRYRLSPIVSGLVYCGYLYYLIQMIYQTEEEQQKTASSNEFPASWTDTTVGSAFVGIFGVAFMIAFATQLVNAITGNFIPDLSTSDPTTTPTTTTTAARKWEARTVHLFGRIGFGGRAAMFGTLSGFFWESLAERNESGELNVVAAAIGKLSTHTGGLFFMVILGLSLIIYGIFAIANAYYKYFPTPPPSRIPLYALTTADADDDDDDNNIIISGKQGEDVASGVQSSQQLQRLEGQEGQEEQEGDRRNVVAGVAADHRPGPKIWWRRLWMRVYPTSSANRNSTDDIEKQQQ